MTKIRVLVLEDDDSLRKVLTEVLEEHGYEVVASPTGEQAVALARESAFDLMVADIRMHGMDGLSALEQVREQQPGVRSLVVTGYSTEADSIRAIRLGVGDYLKKPFSLETFLSSVNRLVSEKLREREIAGREEALRRAAVWAIESVASSFDLASPREANLPGVVELGRLAARTAAELGLPSAAVTEVQVAVLLVCLEQRTQNEVPEFLLEGLSSGTHRLRARLLETLEPDPSLGLASQV
ncbi:MAG: response regulator, partial [Candidatus Eremiobacterota bacterium]